MRYFEISSGFRVPVSSEEREIITKVGNASISMADLDEREAQVALEMTVRGLLRRTENDEGTYYETDKMDLWRF
jgi:hypothetical protein